MAGQRVECGTGGEGVGTDELHEGGQRRLVTSELKLLLDRDRFELKVEGIAANVDEALCMLETAARHLEAEFHARKEGKTLISSTVGRVIFPRWR